MEKEKETSKPISLPAGGAGGFFLNSAAALSFVPLLLYYNLVLANTSIEKKTILFLLI